MPAEQGKHPNSLAILSAQQELNAEQAAERKQRFLDAFRTFTQPNKEGNLQYPNVSLLARSIGIPFYTVMYWHREDKTFREEYEAILTAFDDAVKRSLFNATQAKWGVGYASTWLKMRGLLKENIEHSGTISHIEVVSSVRKSKPVNVLAETTSEDKAVSA